MAVEYLNGLNNSEADSVVAVGCMLMASGLAGAVGRGESADGTYYVEILAPEGGAPMFLIGKERGRYYVCGQDGGRLADGRSLDGLVSRPVAGVPGWMGRNRAH